MASDKAKWLEKQGISTPYKEWVRSWRQTFETPLGSKPYLIAHLERVRIYNDGRTEKEGYGEVKLSISELVDIDIKDANAIQAAMTRLIGKKVKEKEKKNSAKLST